MKRVLVTGGAGFLGSHLCDRLLAEGHLVIAVDNLHTGSLKNIEHLAQNPHFEFIEQDICEPLDLQVDEIYNLACPASPIHYQENPIRTFETSVLGTRNMLLLAKNHGAKLLQASTSEVYGDPQVHPQVESYWGHVNPIGIRSCYDEGKRGAETLCFDFRRVHGLRVKVVRIFNTYGPRMHPQDGRVVSNFVVQALKGQDLTVYGQGQQTRSFCYYSDLIEGIYLSMQTPDDFSGPINLGNPHEFTILELAKKVLELVPETVAGSGEAGSQASVSKIVHRELPADDPTQRRPNISLAQKVLDWTPQVELDEGLRKTMAYFKSL